MHELTLQELFKAHIRSAPPSRVFRYAKALFLLGGSAAGFALGVLGFCLLFSLFTLRLLAPALDKYSAELYFDFTQPLAVATTHLQSGLTLDPSAQAGTPPKHHPRLSVAPIQHLIATCVSGVHRFAPIRCVLVPEPAPITYAALCPGCCSWQVSHPLLAGASSGAISTRLASWAAL